MRFFNETLRCPKCKIKLVFCGEGEFYYCERCNFELDIFEVKEFLRKKGFWEKLIDFIKHYLSTH